MCMQGLVRSSSHPSQMIPSQKMSACCFLCNFTQIRGQFGWFCKPDPTQSNSFKPMVESYIYLVLAGYLFGCVAFPKTQTSGGNPVKGYLHKATRRSYSRHASWKRNTASQFQSNTSFRVNFNRFCERNKAGWKRGLEGRVGKLWNPWTRWRPWKPWSPRKRWRLRRADHFYPLESFLTSVTTTCFEGSNKLLGPLVNIMHPNQHESIKLLTCGSSCVKVKHSKKEI